MRQQIDWGCRFVLEISGGAFAMTDPRNGGYKSSMTTKSSKSDEEGGTHTSFGFESAEKRRWGSKSIGDVDSSLKSLERLSPKLSPRRRENQEKGEKKRHGATFPTLFRLPIECCHVPRKDEAQRPKLRSVYNVIRSFWFISRPNINKNGLWDER